MGEKWVNSSEQFAANDRDLLRDFDLSRNKSLRTLETTAQSIADADSASNFLITVFSSVTSPPPIDVVIIYRNFEAISGWLHHFYCEPRSSCFYCFWLWKPAGYLHNFKLAHIKMLQEVHNIQNLRLLLCADVSDHLVDHTTESLEHILNMETAKGELDHLCRPLVISERRVRYTRCGDDEVGHSKDRGVWASAL